VVLIKFDVSIIGIFMKTVVTGANGHIGANLIRALMAKGRKVGVLLHLNRQAFEGLEVDIVEGDTCDLDSLLKAFEGADVVYNLAGYISLRMDEREKCQAVNVDGTKNVVEACLRNGVSRLIHVSSIHALEQEPIDIPVDEIRPLITGDNHPPYDISKAEGEREVFKGIEKGLDAVIINPTAVVGPSDYYPSHFGEVLLSLACGKLPALVNGGFDWVDARDVAYGAMRAEETAPRGSKYLLSGHWASMIELARMVKEILDVNPPRITCPLWMADIGAPMATLLARFSGKRPLFTKVSLAALRGNKKVSHAKASAELGYHPRPLKETIADTLNWFKSNGRLP
jgi:dihydroflavonol-4-reductase